jgi:hypothetical protein
MKFSETNAYRTRAASCCHKSDMANDARIKKYWDDLADDWLALADVLIENDRHGKALH